MSETRSGYKQSINGLFGAIAISLLLIAVIWGLSRFQRHDHLDPAPAVDYSAQLAQARSEAPFGVLAPSRVPAGWRATSADWKGAGPQVTWHLGFVTGQGSDAEYVGLDQSNGVASDVIAATTRADQPGTPATVGGVTWSTLTAADGGETALVLRGNDVTTIVSGTASEAVLAMFAATLSVD